MTWSKPAPSAAGAPAAELASPEPAAPEGAGRSRSRSSAVCPGGTVTWYQNAHLVPSPTGLTVAAPWITWSLMPSLGYGVTGAAPYNRARLVSFSQNSSCGPVPSGPAAAMSSRVPRNGWSMATDRSPEDRSPGRASPSPQDQVLRNHAVGSTWTVSASGPALV